MWDLIRAQHKPEGAGAFMPLNSLKTKTGFSPGLLASTHQGIMAFHPLSAIRVIVRAG
jgi:hypothetical protein